MTATAAQWLEIRWRELGTEQWSDPVRHTPVGEIVIAGLDRGKVYEYQARAISFCGAASAWALPVNYTVPDDPEGTVKLADTAAEVAAITADGVLSKGEKGGEIRRYSEITAELANIRAQADAFTVSRTSYDAAVSALDGYLLGLNPAWNDVTQNTPIVATTYRDRWNGYYTQRTLLLNAIAAKAKSLADAAKSAADAASLAASNAQTAADSALQAANDADAILDRISADGWLTRDEKPAVAQQVAIINAEIASVRASADAFVVSRVDHDNAKAALDAYLAGLSPAWNDNTQDTAIVRATFDSKFTAYYQARQSLLDAIAAKAKALADAAQLDATDAKNKTDLGLNPNGTIKSGLNEVDFLIDGPLYGRPLKTRLSLGKPLIDFSEGIHLGKNIDNIADGSTYRRIGSGYADSSGRVVKLWDGTLPRDAATVWSYANSGKSASDDLTAIPEIDRTGKRVRYTSGELLDELKPITTAFASEVVDNATFSLGADGDGNIPGWEPYNGSTLSVVSVGGTVGLRFTSAAGSSFGGISRRKYSVGAGDYVRVSANIYSSSGQLSRIQIRWFNTSDAAVGTPAEAAAGIWSGWDSVSAAGAAPSTVAYYRIVVYNPNTNGGTGYATNIRASVNDLRVAGSGVRVGDPHNLPQSQVNSFGSVPSATALSATSAGAITVNAHTNYTGGPGANVHYSAVTNAITGKAQGSTWVVYCLDPDYQGGLRTWSAVATMNEAMQAGDGAYPAGIITIPASGSSSGGTGGDGDPDMCVDWDTVLPDGRLLRSLIPGIDGAWCVDVATGKREWVTLRAMGHGVAECYLLASDRAEIIQSRSTPMDLPDGRVVRTPEMLGEPILPWAGGIEPVATLTPLGPRPVLKPDFGNRMFYAGVSADRCLATHNARWKP